MCFRRSGFLFWHWLPGGCDFLFKSGFFSFFVFVTSAPIFSLALTVVAIVFWVRFFKQTLEYARKEKELDVKRQKCFAEYQTIKEEYDEKMKNVEVVIYRKAAIRRQEEAALDDKRDFEELFHSGEKTKSPED